MGFFGELLRKQGVPEWASFLSAGQYAIFATLVEGELRARSVPYVLEDGVVQVGEGDGSRRYGLLNLAQTCARVPPESWTAVVSGHFDRLFAADDESAAIGEALVDFDAVRSLLRVRLFPPNVEGPERITWPLADGLVVALVFDLPSAIRTVAPDEAAGWSVSHEELRAIAMENLRHEPAPRRERLDARGVMLESIHGDSFFTASHALALPEVNDARMHPHGALVAVPTRHGALFHPIVDLTCVGAVNALAMIADGMHREGPGGISPSLYWARGGRWMRIPTQLHDGRLDVTPPEPFVTLLESLAQSTPS